MTSTKSNTSIGAQTSSETGRKYKEVNKKLIFTSNEFVAISNRLSSFDVNAVCT